MKRAVINEVNILEEKLTGYAAMLNYRYLNLCVKAEEASLLPVIIIVEGESKKIEDTAIVAKKNDYQFIVVPKFEEDLQAVGKGIAMSHPEFKQEIEVLTVNSVDDNVQPVTRDVNYILLTMPEVDDNRYDVLKQGVDTLYQDSKSRMDEVISSSSGKIISMAADESPEDIDRLKKALDKMKDDKKEKIDKLKADKLKEVEDAHDKWLAEQAEKEQQRATEAAARGTDKLGSMKMNNNYDE